MNNDICCSVCGISIDEVSNMFRLNNDEVVCGKRCIFEYAWNYFHIVTLKGRPLIKPMKQEKKKIEKVNVEKSPR